MQNTLFKILFICILLSSCNFFNTPEFDKGRHVRDENYETIANRITKQVALRLRQEKNLQCAGAGGGMMSNIRMMAISFDFIYEVNLTEARQLLVYATTEYLNAINTNKEIRPYLQNYPFRVNNIEVMIFIQKPDGQNVSPGKIVSISSINSILSYDLLCEPENYINKELCRETYEEALKIVQDEELANQTKAS